MALVDDTEEIGHTWVQPEKLRRNLLIGIGTVSVALGMLGVFVPVLPTTPFLLMAAVCYAPSPRRFYHWLMTNRWCGDYVRHYREGRGIPLRQKAITALLLWLTIGLYRPWALWPDGHILCAVTSNRRSQAGVKVRR